MLHNSTAVSRVANYPCIRTSKLKIENRKRDGFVGSETKGMHQSPTWSNGNADSHTCLRIQGVNLEIANILFPRVEKNSSASTC